MTFLNKKLIIRIISIVIIAVILFFSGKILIRIFVTTEGYTSDYSGNINDAGDHYVHPNLYQEDKGRIGTRNIFSIMRKPYLNPILVPLIKSETE